MTSKKATPHPTRPRLKKLIVKNFRAIGNQAVEIDLDDIVVLVGPNNSGKSSILRAYEVIMSEGAKEGKLEEEDFPNGKVQEAALPEIELHTVVIDDRPGEEWCERLEDGSFIVKEKWTWTEPGDPKRVGFNVELGRWAEDGDAEKVPWGAAGVARARRPQPHRVSAFDPPEQQTDEILRLIDTVLKENLEERRTTSEGSEIDNLIGQIKEIQSRIVEESKESIAEVESSLSELISRVFPRHRIVLDPRSSDVDESKVGFFSNRPILRMGPEGGHLSEMSRQGSGARRTLLWTALKLLVDKGLRARPLGSSAKKVLRVDKDRPHLLLMDEPEICLHPSAIREACDLLYGLPDEGDWQVMVTTHSPVFIDFSKDNTTIVRVEVQDDGEVSGTTIFQPDRVQLDEDDRRRLKLLNLCDPYVAEFFFGGRTVIVEGDTEHTAFAQVRQRYPEEFSDVHVLRARGKATIVSLMKILNHFGAPYAILHDSDRPKAKRRDGTEMVNPAWSKNRDIIRQADEARDGVRVAAAVPNFDVVFLGGEIRTDKPYEALQRLEQDPEQLEKIADLLRFLLGKTDDPPEGVEHIRSVDQFDELARYLEVEEGVPAGGG